MKKIGLFLAFALMTATAFCQSEISLSGAGATFPLPFYNMAFGNYTKTTGEKVTYGGVGSGAGIKSLTDKVVDFGATDAFLSDADLKAMPATIVHIPTCSGAVVVSFNLPGITEIKMTPEILVDILLGEIKNWDNASLKKLNPGVKFPNLAITVVYRSDGSGTTNMFTDYLTKVSKDWKEKVGNDKAVEWPVGLGGKGNEGVAAFVGKVDGSIGYVEYAYALQNKMASVMLKNHDGKYVAPTAENFQAAAAGADWAHAEGYYMVLTDQPGANSWPITGASFILVYKNQTNAAQAKEVLKFFAWSFKNGDKSAMALDYVPMPEAVVKMVEMSWQKELKDQDGKAIWP